MVDDPRTLYIDLVKKSLLCSLYEGNDGTPWRPRGGWRRSLLKALVPADVRYIERVPNELREGGHDWPTLALTMVGSKRLDNIHECVETVIRDGIPGDLIETGVWRGGSTILMRAILKAHGVTDRTVWVADSFAGLPKPDAEKYPADEGDKHWTYGDLVVTVDQVKANFERFALLDGQVKFLKGWFKDTLPTAPFEKLAIARLDGDMYESTIDAFEALYAKLSSGGFLIVDDYGGVPACKRATDDFRARMGITEAIIPIDTTGVFWRKN